MPKPFEDVEKETDELMRVLGRCLSQWSEIELNMSAMFTGLHLPSVTPGKPEYKALRAAYDCVVSFEVRLAMLDETISQSPMTDDLLREHWPSLHSRISKKVRKRHQLAHFGFNQDPKTEERVVQPFSSYSGSVQGKLETLKLNDLKVRYESFDRLAQETNAYARYVMHLGPLKADRKQVDRLTKTIRQRASLTP